MSGKDLLMPHAVEIGTRERAGMDLAVYVSAVNCELRDEEFASPIEALTGHAAARLFASRERTPVPVSNCQARWTGG